MFTIYYHPDVVKKDIPAIGKTEQQRLRVAIEKKLTTKPEIFGTPLRASLAGYRKLRVGDYRVIFKIEDTTIFILAIMHRKEVYNQVPKRIS